MLVGAVAAVVAGDAVVEVGDVVDVVDVVGDVRDFLLKKSSEDFSTRSSLKCLRVGPKTMKENEENEKGSGSKQFLEVFILQKVF